MDIEAAGEGHRYRGVDRLMRKKYWTHCSCAAFLISLILFCSSFKTLGPYKYGLLQNQVTRRVYFDSWEDSVWEPGVYLVGFWNGFLTFPSTISTIQYSVDQPEEGVVKNEPLYLRSSDKVSIELEVSVQYLRKKAELVELFRKAMTATLQESLFASVVRAELTKVMSRHDVSDCWEHRETLVQEFMRACEEVLAKSHALCWGLQFYRAKAEERYERALVVTQVQKQREMIEMARKRAAVVRSETKVLLANATNRIKVVEAEGQAARYQLEAAARSSADAARVSAEAAAVEYAQEALRLSNRSTLTEAQMTEYQEALALGSSLRSLRLFYGLSSPPAYLAMSSAAGRRLEGNARSHGPPPGSDAGVQPQLPAPQSEAFGHSWPPPPREEPSHGARAVPPGPLTEL